jgi:hypothetical protein
MRELRLRRRAGPSRQRRRLQSWERPEMLRLPTCIPPELHPAKIPHNWYRYRRGHAAYLPVGLLLGTRA